MVAITTMPVLHEVALERERQDVKWGQQNHPNVFHRPLIPAADKARRACDVRHELGEGSYADIVVEELAEACDEALAGNVANLREELVQTAACVVAWIEAIDRGLQP